MKLYYQIKIENTLDNFLAKIKINVCRHYWHSMYSNHSIQINV